MKSTGLYLATLLAVLPASLSAQTETNSVSAPLATSTDSAPATATTSSSTNNVLTLPPPNNTVSGTVETYRPTGSNGEINLTEEQKEKIRAMLKRSQLNDEEKKRQAELLDKTPVLEDKVNPGITEKGGIPKRF